MPPSYDVIIVGAGSAGAPLAARLSEDPARSVLLLEAGPRFTGANYPPELRHGGILSAMLPGHACSWNLVATLGEGMVQPLPRGKVVGGSSAVNGTLFTRGHKADFDAWAREGNDEFGAVLVSGDFDGDGFDDLAIGVPREEAGSGGGSVDSGEVKIAYGAAGGFNLARSQQFTQSSIPGSGETSQIGDRFGAALAVGDFDRDGRDDLAIGAPDEGIATADGMDGHVTILMGRSHGISPSRARGLVAGRKGIPGSFSEHNKNFGWALAAGDFDGDGHDDLAIGAPFENLGALGDAGAQTILYGSLFADGFESGPGFEFWSSVTP